MPEDQIVSPAPGPTNGSENRPEPEQEQKPHAVPETKPHDDNAFLNPKEHAGSAKYDSFNTGNTGPSATGDNATANAFYGTVFQGPIHQGADTSQIEDALRGVLQEGASFPDASVRKQRRQKMRGAAFVSGTGDCAKAESIPLQGREALSQWYYEELNEYEQCFVQAMAVFDGATVSDIGEATKKLFEPLHQSLSSKDRQSEDEEDTTEMPGKGPRGKLLAVTYTKACRISRRDRYLWQDTDSSGVSQFKLRVLHFLAEEAPTWFESTFLGQLKEWADHLADNNEFSALYALGIIYWHDSETLKSIAQQWARNDENWYRAAYLLEGAYEAGANEKEKSPVLEIVESWVKNAYTPEHVNEGYTAAFTYMVLGSHDPQLALKGLDSLQEIPEHMPDGQEPGMPVDLYTAIVWSYRDLAASGQISQVLQHLAQRVELLSHQRLELTGMKRDERELRRLQRQLSLLVAFNAFFHIVVESLVNLKNDHWVKYDLTQALPSPLSFENEDGREVLLAGVLIQGASPWRSEVRTLLCATLVERLGFGDFAYLLMRDWSNIVLKDQSAHPDQVRKSYVQFLIEVGTKLEAWCRHLKDLGFRPPPATDMFKRKLGQWQAEGQRRNLPIGALAQEIMELLPF
jgi:hypothetical protein